MHTPIGDNSCKFVARYFSALLRGYSFMSYIKLFLFLFIFYPGFAASQQIDTTAIKNELAAIFERDQKTRTGSDSAAFMQYIDSCNLATIESLVAKYGWPGKSFVGAKGNYTVWLVIQHADLATQEKYLPLMKESVAKSESRPVDLAYLEDRVKMRKGERQLYGTQVSFNKTGGQEIWPIEDEINVNARRAKLGLEPMEEYAKYFGIEYKLPVK
ncbi:MAG: hypothetical protein NTV09_01580 [Bacteroidetes bacterium]|nr:hypothetical protein [Bacteroidota bacterium]